MRLPHKVAILFILFLFSSQGLLGQGSIMTNLKSNLKRADELYNEFSYRAALDLYLRVLEKNPQQGDVKLKIADCYRKLNEPEHTAAWYAKAIHDEQPLEAAHLLYYAQALNATGQYDEAKVWFGKYLEHSKTDHRAFNRIWGINNLSDFYRDSSQYSLQKLSINSKASDFGPSYYKDGIVFISAVGKELFVHHVNSWDQTAPLDLYYSKMHKNGGLAKPHKFHGNVNSRYHEGPAVFYNDDQNMIFTRSLYQNGKLRKSSDGINRIGLFTAARHADSQHWTDIKPLPFNSESYSVGHPAITRDGQALYFISDMPGGEGGLDLYVSRREGDNWGKPVNLGPKINTEGNEMFPFLSADSVLYFSSDGYGGLGGLDVYKVDLSGRHGLRVYNLGYPINTYSDDFGLILNQFGSGGFLASNRKGGSGSDDIYQFGVLMLQIETSLTDAASGTRLKGVQVTLTESRTQQDIPGTVKEDKVYFQVKQDGNYILKSQKEGYANRIVLIPTHTRKPGDTLTIRAAMVEVKPVSTRLVVQVHDPESGQPVPGATVYLLDEVSSDEKYATTDEKGFFSFHAHFASSYALVAEKGKLAGLVSGVVAHNPVVQPNDTVRIPLYGTQNDPPVPLECTVIDAKSHQVIKDARVRLFEMASEQEVQVSQRDGKVSFTLKPKHYILKIDKETYAPKSLIISAKNLREQGRKIQVKVQLEKEKPTSTQLVAYVYDEITKQPEAGAEVFLLNEITGDNQTLYTDAKGNFSFKAAFSDTYACIIDKPGKSNLLSDIRASNPSVMKNDTIRIPLIHLPDANPQVTKEVYPEILLPVLSKIEEENAAQQPGQPIVMEGFAVDAYSGKHLEEAQLTLTDNTTHADLKGRLHNGKCYFDGITGRNYIFKGNQPGYARKAVILSGEHPLPGDTVVVKLLLDKLKPADRARIAHVYDSATGNPVAGALVYLLNEFTSDEKRSKTDAKGNFSFSATPESSYAIIAETHDKYGMLSSIAANQPGDTVRIPLETLAAPSGPANPLVIRAIFTDDKSGQRLGPVKARLVEWRTAKEKNGAWKRNEWTCAAQSNQSYLLKASHEGYKAIALPVHVPTHPAGDTVEVLVKLQKRSPAPVPILAQVVDNATGKAIPGVHVYLLNTITSEEKRLVTDGKGNFNFTASHGASYDVIAEKGHHSAVLSNITPSETSLIRDGMLRIVLGEDRTAPQHLPTLATRAPAAREPADARTRTVSFAKEPSGAREPVESKNARKAVSSSTAATTATVYALRNNSGKHQVFVNYKDQVYEFKKEENLQYLRTLSTKMSFVIDQTEDEPVSDLLELLLHQLADSHIEVGQIIQIQNIFYGVDQSGLVPEVKAELDKLIAFLNTFKSTRLELKAYTDSRETDAYNYRLSERRARAAYEYLVSHGIDPSRVKIQALGEKGLVNHCHSGEMCDESFHGRNRRTEFHIRY